MKLSERFHMFTIRFLSKILGDEKGRIDYFLLEVIVEAREILTILSQIDDSELLRLGVDRARLVQVSAAQPRVRESDSTGSIAYGMVQWLISLKDEMTKLSGVEQVIPVRWKRMRTVVGAYNGVLKKLRDEGKIVGVDYPLLPDFPEL